MPEAERPTALDVRAFALATGLTWAIGVVLLGISAKLGRGERWRDLLGDLYVGYERGWPGLTVGAIWGFADAFCGGAAVAWLYNRFR